MQSNYKKYFFWSVFTSIFLIYVIYLFSIYNAKLFGFHDLGLINDFMSNTVYGRGFFRISQLGVSHFAFHSTPTLILFTPLYRLFDSQFILIVLNITAVFTASLILMKIFSFYIKNNFLIFLGFWMMFIFNKYTKTIVIGAHYEIFYLLFTLLFLYFFLSGRRFYISVIMFILAIGTRTDAGIFLFFTVISIIVAQRMGFPFNIDYKKGFVLAGIAFVYTVIIILLVQPVLSSGIVNHASKFWGSWGNSWEDIFTNIIKHPVRFFATIGKSGFFDLNFNAGIFGIFNPVMLLINNIGGIVFYISDAYDKRILDYYNSTFLLPGLFLCNIAGLYYLTNKYKKFEKYLNYIFAIIILVSVVELHSSVSSLKFKFYAIKSLSGTETVAMIKDFVAKNPKVKTVSTDYKNFVFVPNHLGKVLFSKYQQADAVFVFKDSYDNFYDIGGTTKGIVERLGVDRRFAKTVVNDDMTVYVRN